MDRTQRHAGRIDIYTLFWHPWSSSYAPMAVLEELGVAFELHEVNYEGGETGTAAYRKLQPLGLIPALKLDGERSMFESAAIVLYLCEMHPEAGLAPDPGGQDRPAFLQWLLFLADTVYPSYSRYYHPDRYTASPADADAVKSCAKKSALEQLRVIEARLQKDGPWLLGSGFSACDIYSQMITTWHETPKDLFDNFPSIRQLAYGVTQRDACRRAIRRHHFATGFED